MMPMPKKTEKEEEKQRVYTLRSDRVDLLLFVHNPTHPQLEIAEILWDFTQLCLFLDLFLCPAMHPDCVLV